MLLWELACVGEGILPLGIPMGDVFCSVAPEGIVEDPSGGEGRVYDTSAMAAFSLSESVEASCTAPATLDSAV